MSSSFESNEGDVTLIKTRVTVSQTEVTAPKGELQAELQEIRADLGKVGKGALKSLSGFKTFILRGNLVDLAIGIVIGAAFTALVNAVVKDIITPLIPVINNKGGSGLSTFTWHIPGTYITFQVGDFVNATLSFLIVAAVLYFFVVQPVSELVKLYHPSEAAHTMRDCPYCFQAVHINATRCPFCTSHLKTNTSESEAQEPVLILPESLEHLSDELADRIVRKATSRLEKVAAEAAGESNAARE